jgi:transcriptional regulator with XRE-family HTH domain
MSQEQLAGRAELHRTYISDVERGTRNLSMQSLAQLAEALDLPAWRLILQAQEDHHGQQPDNNGQQPNS